MSAFDQIRDVYFGSAGTPLRLSPEQRRRVLWASIAPAVIVGAVLISTALSIIYGPGELAGGPFGYGAPFLVRRLYIVAISLRTLSYLALALLFAAGLQPWTRAEGSWMILIGTALAIVAVLCGAFVVGVYAVHGMGDFSLRTDLWMDVASSFGLMAVGYFFLAYRGATADEDGDGEEPGEASVA